MSDADGAYIRGSGGSLDRRKVAWIGAGFIVVIVLTLVIVLTVQALNENTRVTRLRSSGTRVDVTVTSCFAIASGTGITAAGYQCKGAFTLDGRSYTEQIAGTKTLYTVGQTVHAVVDPSDPTNLSPADAVATKHTSLTGLILPAVLLLALILAAAIVLLRVRKAGSQGTARTA